MKMHRAMIGAVGSDATETWVRKMIEHHRGAIEMSQIVLRDARDAQVREMATKSSAEQRREIDELQTWLRAHGKRAQCQDQSLKDVDVKKQTIAALAGMFLESAASAATPILVHRDPGCASCGKWAHQARAPF